MKAETHQMEQKKENAKQIPHDYKVGKKVLYGADSSSKFVTYEGPYKVVKVNDNGSVCMRKRSCH